MFSFMASYLLFWKKKIGDRKRYDPWKNSKKKTKKQKTAQKTSLSSVTTWIAFFGLENIEIWFSLFL